MSSLPPAPLAVAFAIATAAAALPVPRVVAWKDVPRGSLCEVTIHGMPRLFVRWQTPDKTLQKHDSLWLPTAKTNAPSPSWPWSPDNPYQGPATVFAEGLNDTACKALASQLGTRDDIVAVGRVLGATLQTTAWRHTPTNSISIIVVDKGLTPGLGEILWRRLDGKYMFLGQTKQTRPNATSYVMTDSYAICGSVAVLHTNASSIVGITEMFKTHDVAGVLRACGVSTDPAVTASTAPAPATTPTYKVGDVIAWKDVQPGSMVRLPDGDEVLRWAHPDTDGDDCSYIHNEVDALPMWKFPGSSTEPKSSCVVLGAGLSQQLCDAIGNVEKQLFRWAIASQTYFKNTSTMAPGTLWSHPGGWGATYSTGKTTWTWRGDGDDDASKSFVNCASTDDVRHLERRLAQGTYDDDDDDKVDDDMFPPGYGQPELTLSHVEMCDVSDADLERIVNADDPQVALCDVAERRWGSDWSAGRGWLGRAVAEYATLHLPPEHREAIAIRAQMVILGMFTSPFEQGVHLSTTLGALGIYIARAGDTYLGWWGHPAGTGPTRAQSIASLLLAYLRDPPDDEMITRAVLGTGEHDRIAVFESATKTPSVIMRRDDDAWAKLEHAGRVSAALANKGVTRVRVPSAPILRDHRGIAWLAYATSASREVIDCGLQPVDALHPNCDVLVLWPFEPGLSGIAKLETAAMEVLRARGGATSTNDRARRLRVQVA